MYRLSKLRFGFPIGLFFWLLIDGTVSQVFSVQLFRTPSTMVSHLVVLWLVCGAIFEADSALSMPLARWAAVAGPYLISITRGSLVYTSLFFRWSST
nr:hypothetical protein [Levilactobacillus brevis]